MFDNGGLERLMALIALLDRVARHLTRHPIASPGYVAKVKSAESAKINIALNHIHENLREPIALGEVAGMLDVSDATCNRLFRKSLGKSFKDFLIEVRISHACKLLIETDGSIITIAGACGFPNLSNFNKQFKRRKGETPREYRQHMTPSPRQLTT